MRVFISKLSQVLVAVLAGVLAVGWGLNLAPTPAAAADSASIPLTIEYRTEEISHTSLLEGTVEPFASGTSPTVAPVEGSLATGAVYGGIFFRGDNGAELQVTELSSTQSGDSYTIVLNQSAHPEVRLSYTGTADQIRQHLIARYTLSSGSLVTVTINKRNFEDITISSPYKTAETSRNATLKIPRSGGTFTFTATRKASHLIQTSAGTTARFVKDISPPAVDPTAQNTTQQWEIIPPTTGNSVEVTINRYSVPDSGNIKPYLTNSQDYNVATASVDNSIRWPYDSPIVGFKNYTNTTVTNDNNWTYGADLGLRVDVTPPTCDTNTNPNNCDTDKISRFYFMQSIDVNGQRIFLPQPKIEPFDATGDFSREDYLEWYLAERKKIAAMQTMTINGTGSNTGSIFTVRLFDARTGLDPTFFRYLNDGTNGINLNDDDRESYKKRMQYQINLNEDTRDPNNYPTIDISPSNLSWNGPNNSNVSSDLLSDEVRAAIGNQWSFRYKISITKVRPTEAAHYDQTTATSKQELLFNDAARMTLSASLLPSDGRIIRNIESTGISSLGGNLASTNGTTTNVSGDGEVGAFGIYNGSGSGDSAWTVYTRDGRPAGDLSKSSTPHPGSVQDHTYGTNSLPSVLLRYQVLPGYKNPSITSNTLGSAGQPASADIIKTAAGQKAYVPLIDAPRTATYTAGDASTEIARVGQVQGITVTAELMQIPVYSQSSTGTLSLASKITTANIESAREIRISSESPTNGPTGQTFRGYQLYYSASDTAGTPLTKVSGTHYQPGQILFLDEIAKLVPLNTPAGDPLVGAFSLVEDWGPVLGPKTYTLRQTTQTYASGSATPTTGDSTYNFDAVPGLTAEVINQDQVTQDGLVHSFDSGQSRAQVTITETTASAALQATYVYRPAPPPASNPGSGLNLQPVPGSGSGIPSPSPSATPSATPSPSAAPSTSPVPSAAPSGTPNPGAAPQQPVETRVIIAEGGQTVNLPQNLIPVVDQQMLAASEKARVIQELLQANPQLGNNVQVKIDNMGNISLTFFDGTTLFIPAEKVIYEIANLPKGKARGELAETGQDNQFLAAAAALLLLTGLLLTQAARRRSLKST